MARYESQHEICLSRGVKKLLHLIVFLVSGTICNAQEDVKWASPNVKHMPVGRGINLSYTRIFSSMLESRAEVPGIQNNNAFISSLENIEYDIKVPKLIRDRTQLLTGFEYTYDYFQFDNSEDIDYEFYNKLDRRNLRSRKLKLYFTHSLSQRRYMYIRGSVEINGDISDSEQPIHEFAKYSLAFTYGWQKSPTNAYGIGVYMDYTLGRPVIYPVFEWNKSWNKKWGFESKIPAKFMLRFTPHEGLHLYGGYHVDGISYRVVTTAENSGLLDEFEIRRSDVKLSFSLEKRIHDFIWAGLECGLNYNIRLDASDDDKLYKDQDLITSQLKPASYINLSLFVVPTNGLKKLLGFKR